MTSSNGYIAKVHRFSVRLWKSIWLFPVLLTVPLIIFTLFQISGTSSGYYHGVFEGSTKDKRLVLGQPRSIRSDEWLVNNQMMVAQKSDNFERINKNIGNGVDMSLLIDVPHKDWSIIFKPHNLGFFVLPFDNAFAFRWWLMAYLLIMSCYLFVVTLLPGRRLFGALISLTLFFSPLVQWWYLYGTLGSLYYCLFGGVVLIKLFESRRLAHAAIWGGLLAYLATCFVLVLYPPFQIPCALVMFAFVAGYLLYKFKTLAWSEIWKKLLIIAGAVVVTGVILLAFFAGRQNVIQTVKNTDYPGVRNTLSGTHDGKNDTNFGLLKTFSAPLAFGLQNDKKGANFYTNQSEASSFILINFIFAPFVLLALYKKGRKHWTLNDYLFIATSAILVLFAIRSFTPFFNLPFKFLLLNQVQNERLLPGLMLLCIIQIILLGNIKEKIVSKKEAIFAAVVGFALFADGSVVMANRFPIFKPSMFLIIAVNAAVGLVIYLILQKKGYVWGLALFLVINVLSTFSVNPLYAKSQPESLETIISQVKNNYPDQKEWAVFDQLITENVPLMAGKPALTGVQPYPQLDLWHTLDLNSKEKSEYNRYAHVIFTVAKFPDGGRFSNPQPDVLLVSFDCEMAKKIPNFGHVLSTPVIDVSSFSCLKEKQVIELPEYKLHIYNYTQ